MKRRAHWLAVVGSATLGLATVLGNKGLDTLARAAEPDDPRSLPSLQLSPIDTSKAQSQSAPAEDPFAPITVDQFLPASSGKPLSSTPAYSPQASGSATVGYLAAPAPMNSTSGMIAPPSPMAVMHPSGSGSAPMSSGAHAWDMNAALNGGCPSCGHQGGSACDGMYRSLIDNMVIFSGADYFSNAGGINFDRLLNADLSLNHEPVKVPDLDPHRIGGFLGLNAGVPLTPDGQICMQFGFMLLGDEDGDQAFVTGGFYHRANPGEDWGMNWGIVYDLMYDDFLDYQMGQLRFKAGIPITASDELGGWFTVGNKVEQVNVTLVNQLIATPDPQFFDTIHARVRPISQGHFFWRHVFGCGADTSIFVGARESNGGAFMLGSTASVPINDCWAIMGGGHWSHDSDTIGSFDAYLGIALYPGGNARVSGVCGNRYLPYQDVANNTYMPMALDPLYLQIETDKARL